MNLIYFHPFSSWRTLTFAKCKRSDSVVVNRPTVCRSCSACSALPMLGTKFLEESKRWFDRIFETIWSGCWFCHWRFMKILLTSCTFNLFMYILSESYQFNLTITTNYDIITVSSLCTDGEWSGNLIWTKKSAAQGQIIQVVDGIEVAVPLEDGLNRMSGLLLTTVLSLSRGRLLRVTVQYRTMTPPIGNITSATDLWWFM